MVSSKALELCGLELMAQKEDGSEKCPICEALKWIEDDWIEGPANAALNIAREKGLVPPVQ